MVSKGVESVFLNIIGVFFVVVGVAALINTVYLYYQGDSLSPIIWLCYLGVILLGVGILFRSSLLVVSQLNILAIPLILWSIDFIYILINGSTLLGISGYFFELSTLIGKIISLQHLITVPLAFFALYLMKIKKNYAWIISFVEVSVIFFITRLIVPSSENINCVYRSCMILEFGGYYPIFWFIFFFLMIFVTDFILRKISFLNNLKS